VDMTRPFTFVLDLRPGLGLFSVRYPGERRIVDGERIASSLTPANWWTVAGWVLALLVLARIVFVVRHTR
jgi:hypothetical protein